MIGDCGTSATSCARSRRPIDSKGRPWTCTDPGPRTAPVRYRSSVDFPAPFGPTIDTHSPAGTCSDTSSSTSESPSVRSEEHTSELQSLMRISYAVFCLKKKKKTKHKYEQKQNTT